MMGRRVNSKGERNWLVGWLVGTETLTGSLEPKQSRTYFLFIPHIRKRGPVTVLDRQHASSSLYLLSL